MKVAPIAVLGLGGVGGMLAARSNAICVGTARTVGVIRARGLTLVENGGSTVFRPDAVERLEIPVGLLVIAVKAPDLEDALDHVDRASLDGAVVLPLLNGLEHLESLRRRLGDCVAAGSIARLEVFSPEPGVVVQRSSGALVTAASDAIGPETLDAALAPLRVPGVDVAVVADERVVLWEKAARLAVLAAATSASGEPIGVLRADARWRARISTALEEACAVAAADGVPLDVALQWGIIDGLPDAFTTSAARDVAAGRRSELDAITGSVVRAGRRLAIPTPVLAALLAEAERAGRTR